MLKKPKVPAPPPAPAPPPTAPQSPMGGRSAGPPSLGRAYGGTFKSQGNPSTSPLGSGNIQGLGSTSMVGRIKTLLGQ